MTAILADDLCISRQFLFFDTRKDPRAISAGMGDQQCPNRVLGVHLDVIFSGPLSARFDVSG